MDEWYSLVADGELRQGEILLELPIYVPEEYRGIPSEGALLPVRVRKVDAVIITPSCDLVERAKGARKDWVVLCEHWDLEKQISEKAVKKEWVPEIEKGRMPLHYILPASPFREVPMRVRIVSFGRVHSLPIDFVRQHAKTVHHRLRLAPPFCQHFAQAFSACFMRVGLPHQATAYSAGIAARAQNTTEGTS